MLPVMRDRLPMYFTVFPNPREFECSSENVGIRILYQDSGPHVKKFGKEINKIKNGMVLNHLFINWNPACPFEVIGEVVRHTNDGFAICWQLIVDPEIASIVDDLAAIVSPRPS